MIKHRMQIFLIGAWARSFPISKLLVLACRRRETESTSHYPPMCTLPTISRIPYYIYTVHGVDGVVMEVVIRASEEEMPS